jgi:hypothetical protein
VAQIAPMLRLHCLQVTRQIGLHGCRQHRQAVFVALARPDDHLVGAEIEVLHA